MLAAPADHAFSVLGAAIPVHRRNPGKGGDIPGFDLAKFRKIGK